MKPSICLIVLATYIFVVYLLCFGELGIDDSILNKYGFKTYEYKYASLLPKELSSGSNFDLGNSSMIPKPNYIGFGVYSFLGVAIVSAIYLRTKGK